MNPDDLAAWLIIGGAVGTTLAQLLNWRDRRRQRRNRVPDAVMPPAHSVTYRWNRRKPG